jgi:coenzyme F420-reducing hydrogenase alpha subunit
VERFLDVFPQAMDEEMASFHKATTGKRMATDLEATRRICAAANPRLDVAGARTADDDARSRT